MPKERTQTVEESPGSSVLGAGMRTAPRKTQYLLGVRPDANVKPEDLDRLSGNLRRDPGVRILTALDNQRGTPLVFEATPDVAERLVETVHTDLQLQGIVLENDAPLELAGSIISDRRRHVPTPAPVATTVSFRIVGKNDAPVEGAEVTVLGSFGFGRGISDAEGRVQLTVLDEEAAPVVDLIHVRPMSDYWGYTMAQPPLLDFSQQTTVRLAPLDQAFPQFPAQRLVGWGLKAMRVDTLPVEQFDGRGIRIGLISSGCDTHHRNLRHVVHGFDVSTSGSWTVDPVGIGTHCAGILVAGDSASGVRGIAPRATLIPIKVGARARSSDVIAAVERCIAERVDVICFTPVTGERSALLDQKLAEARHNGIACIAGAGDDGGVVQFPASSPHVLAVSAIGWRAAFPSDSPHTQAIPDAGGTQDGYFVARFSASGPELDVCGPGVAAVSSVPPDNFAAWDGTAVAAAHVCGLAALVLAHHPDFQADGQYEQRNARRVGRLFDVLRASAHPFRIGDSLHTGFSLTDAPRALNATVPATEGVPPEDSETWRVLHTLMLAAQRTTGSDSVQHLVETLEKVGLSGY